MTFAIGSLAVFRFSVRRRIGVASVSANRVESASNCRRLCACPYFRQARTAGHAFGSMLYFTGIALININVCKTRSLLDPKLTTSNFACGHRH